MEKIGKARKLRDEKAVSPVIGVILMVAITVILAAIIGMHVFGIVDTVPETKTVSIYGYRNDTTVNFVVTSIDPVGTSITNITSNVGDIGGTDFGIGDEFYITGVDSIGTRVVLVAAFGDGTSQVVYTSKL